tara:strand:- start:280 stop:405 length:126 start_codon:yes stop_codon:yes gene_type:complete
MDLYHIFGDVLKEVDELTSEAKKIIDKQKEINKTKEDGISK